jgi:phosphoglycolate phosphatase
MANQKRFRIPQCVFFDLDGTLLDSLPAIAHSLREAFAVCDLPMMELDFRTLVGPPVRTMLQRLGIDVSETDLDRLEQAFRASYDGSGWQITHCYPGAREMLEAMRVRGMRLFVVSNKPRHIALRILEAEGVAALFEEIVTKDSRQPPYSGKDEMMAILLSYHRLNPGGCLMVGDTLEDGLAAAKARIDFVLMSHGYGGIPDAAEVPVSLRMKHFSEFMPILAEEITR